MEKSNMCICGHDKWHHAIDLKGNIGKCEKEIIKDWKWCDCKKFQSQSDKEEKDAET